MKKQVCNFVLVVLVIVVCILFNQKNGFMNTAGGGLSLKNMNDTTKTSVVTFAEAHVTNEGNMFQGLAIANFEHQMSNGMYVGADMIGTVSTQFGICAPTCDFRLGANFNTFKIEAKMGNFTRNNVKTAGFDPQFQNDLLLLGEGVSVSNAMQVALMTKNTKVLFGHQGGDKFYTLNGGNYYTTIEQNIGKLSLGGGANFSEKVTGYAAAKLNSGNNTFTVTANNIGAQNKNYVLSYNRSNIKIGKNVNMSLGTALWNQTERTGLRMVAGFGKGGMKLFAQAGGYWLSEGFKPVFGLGASYKL